MAEEEETTGQSIKNELNHKLTTKAQILSGFLVDRCFKVDVQNLESSYFDEECTKNGLELFHKIGRLPEFLEPSKFIQSGEQEQ